MDAEEWKVSLPSWRGGSARRSVIAFLQEITQGPGALPVADDTGFVTPEAAADCTFIAAELETGDAVVFSGTAPHYSEANQGGSPRILARITPRFARVLGRQVAAVEPVTVQRRNPAQRTGCG